MKNYCKAYNSLDQHLQLQFISHHRTLFSEYFTQSGYCFSDYNMCYTWKIHNYIHCSVHHEMQNLIALGQLISMCAKWYQLYILHLKKKLRDKRKMHAFRPIWFFQKWQLWFLCPVIIVICTISVECWTYSSIHALQTFQDADSLYMSNCTINANKAQD